MNNFATPAINRAIEVFTQGYCCTQSFAHPYLAELVGPLWVLRDAPRKRGDYRSEEWVAHGVDPTEVDRIVRQESRGRYLICQISGPDEPLDAQRRDYKALGYRLIRSEPLMVHTLAQIESVTSPVMVQRVMTQEMADRLTERTVVRQLLPVHLTEDAPLRAYVALLSDELVGWVRSINVAEAAWCSSMYVRPEFRRRGIARAMLGQMLRDDAASGAKLAVLLASQTGAMLYSVVGYTQVGTMLLFTPKR